MKKQKLKLLLDASAILGFELDGTTHASSTLQPVLRYLATNRAQRARTACDYGEADGRRVVDESVRKCNKFTNVVPILSRDARASMLSRVGGDRLGKPTLLEYDSSGRFDAHTDTKDSKNHVGTLILIPPKHDNAYVGGTLVVGTTSVTPHATKWTSAYIPLDTEHRVTRVQRGRRIVFRFNVTAKPPTRSTAPAKSKSTRRVAPTRTPARSVSRRRTLSRARGRKN